MVAYIYTYNALPQWASAISLNCMTSVMMLLKSYSLCIAEKPAKIKK